MNALIKIGDTVKFSTRYYKQKTGTIVEDVYFAHAPNAGHFTVYSEETRGLHELPRHGNAKKLADGGQSEVDAAHAHYRKHLEADFPKAGWIERFAAGWRAF